MVFVRTIAICGVFVFLCAEVSGAILGQQPSQPLDKDILSVLVMYPVNGSLMGSVFVRNADTGCVIYAVFSNDPALTKGRALNNSDQQKLTTTQGSDSHPSPARFNVFAIPRCSAAEIPAASTISPASLFGLKWRLYRQGDPGKEIPMGRTNVREEPPRPWHEFGSDYFGHYSITVSHLELPITEPLELCAATRRNERICVPLARAQVSRVNTADAQSTRSVPNKSAPKQ